MSLLNLPEEMLEHIVDQLDGFSRLSLALSNPRLQRAALTRGKKIVKIEGIETIINGMLPVGDYVQYLDLSNHFEKSSALEGVILACRDLRVLNVVNANLTFDQLMNILDSLERLDVVSCSLQRVSNEACHDRRVLKAQRSIKRLYVDFIPSMTSMLFLARFLNRCSVIEHLHLNFIALYDTRDERMPNPFPEKAPRWRTLHTVVGTFHLTSMYTLRSCMQMFYDFCRPKARQVFIRQDMKLFPHLWWSISEIKTPEVIVTNNVDALRPLYHIEPELICPPSMLRNLMVRWPEHLVELDLTFVLLVSPELQWRDLIQNTPNLRILACHVCQLPMGPDFDTLNPNGASQKSYLIHELCKLKLHKLHIMVAVQKFAPRDCDGCVAREKCYVLGNFERLQYLDELTLTGIFPSPLLFESIANSRMRILRLCLKKAPRMSGLAEMLMFCKSLKYFKFEAPDLPLHSRAFWEALKSANPLDQICIASDSPEVVDLKMVREFLPKIMRKMDVFHLHADQHPALFKEIWDYTINLKKKEPHRDIKLLARGFPSLSGMRKDAIVVTMPGRNLCCASLLIGKIPLDGWNSFD